MWYGRSAPAPACRIHPLYRSTSSPSSRRKRRHELQPSWGPLLELCRKREQDRKKALSRESIRKVWSQDFNRVQPAGWAQSTGCDLSGKLTVTGSTVASTPEVTHYLPPGGPALQERLAKLRRPSTNSPRPSSSGSLGDGCRSFRPSLDQAGPLAPRRPTTAVHRSLSPDSGGAGAGGTAQSLPRPATASRPMPSHVDAQRGSVPLGAAARRPSMAPAAGPHAIGEIPAQKSGARRGSMSPEQNQQRRPSVRRNSLCARLFDAKMANVTPEVKRSLMLQDGRRRSSQRRMSHLRAAHEAKARVARWSSVRDQHLPDRLEAAFRACSSGGAVTVGAQLAESLLLLGHPYPRHEVLDEIIDRECAGRGSLDREDFILAVSSYENDLNKRLDHIFKGRLRGLREVAAKELPGMFRELGVPLMTGMEVELLSGPPMLDMAAWESVYDDVVTRAGLTREEHSRLRMVFEELEGPSGTITGEELLGALSWHETLTELAGGPRVLRALVQEALDRVATGTVCLDANKWKKVSAAAEAADGEEGHDAVDESEADANGSAFLAAASIFHTRIRMGLHGALKRLGLRDNEVRSAKLLLILEELGFLGAVASDVDTFLRKCNLKGKNVLTYTEFFTIIFRYCQADGVTEEESRDINEVFKRFDEDNSGTLEADEIGPAIRWLGYQPTQYRMYHFAEEIGLNENSHFDALEFRRLAAKYKSMSLKQVRKAFLTPDLAPDGHRMPITELPRLLKLVGYEPTQDEIATLVRQAGGWDRRIDFHGFKKLELLHRRWVQQTMAQNGGFTDGELVNYHQRFLKYDSTRTGMVSGGMLRDLMFEVIPDESKDRNRHRFIVDLLAQLGISRNTSVTFEEYLDIVKRTQEEIDRNMLLQSLRLKVELGFSAADVKQFRDLYQIADQDMSGDIDFEELCAVFSTLTDLDTAAKRELLAHIIEVGDASGHLDFWAFLSIMHSVQSKNWRGLKSLGSRRNKS